MITKRELVRRFLNHDGTNKAWIAEQLYGERSPANTSKLRNKNLGIKGRHFTDDEITRLDQIRKAFIADLI